MNLFSKCLFLLAGALLALNIAAFSLVFFPEVGIDRRTRIIERHHYHYYYIPKGGDKGSPGNPPGG